MFNVYFRTGTHSGLWWCIGSLLQWFLKSAGKVVLMYRCSISSTKLIPFLCSYDFHFFPVFPRGFAVQPGDWDVWGGEWDSWIYLQKIQISRKPQQITTPYWQPNSADQNYSCRQPLHCLCKQWIILYVKISSWIYLLLKMSTSLFCSFRGLTWRICLRDLCSAWTESKEFSGSWKKDCPFSYKVIATLNTGTTSANQFVFRSTIHTKQSFSSYWFG